MKLLFSVQQLRLNFYRTYVRSPHVLLVYCKNTQIGYATVLFLDLTKQCARAPSRCVRGNYFQFIEDYLLFFIDLTDLVTHLYILEHYYNSIYSELHNERLIKHTTRFFTYILNFRHHMDTPWFWTIFTMGPILSKKEKKTQLFHTLWLNRSRFLWNSRYFFRSDQISPIVKVV